MLEALKELEDSAIDVTKIGIDGTDVVVVPPELMCAIPRSVFDSCCMKIENEYQELLRHISTEYVRLPKDKNGDTVHFGDDVITDSGWRLEVLGFGRQSVECSHNPTLVFGGAEDGTWRAYSLYALSHYHAPTVEEVLVQMLEKAVGYSDAHTSAATSAVVEAARKLQLQDEPKEDDE